MKNLIKLLFTMVIFFLSNKVTGQVYQELHLHNGTNCNLTITPLDASFATISGLPAIALNANTDWDNTGVACGTSYVAYVAYWQVDYGACTTIYVDLSGNDFLPFTPIVPPCFACNSGLTKMSGTISAYHTNLPACTPGPPYYAGYQISFDIH